MPTLATLLTPLALLLPSPAVDGDAPPVLAPQAGTIATQALVPEGEEATESASMEWFMQIGPTGEFTVYQVRIEGRVVIRVSPRSPAQRQNLMAELPRGEQPRRMVERKIGKCFQMNAIAGVQPTRDNRLLLYMRDQRLIAASLEKACSARDFYSGFYVEPSRDGKLCIDRDELQSRTGVKCQLTRIRQLVAESV